MVVVCMSGISVKLGSWDALVRDLDASHVESHNTDLRLIISASQSLNIGVRERRRQQWKAPS
eukprot:45197-Eustigmatos_ZCMA.PRE.1